MARGSPSGEDPVNGPRPGPDVGLDADRCRGELLRRRRQCCACGRTAIALTLGQPAGHERRGRCGVCRKTLQPLLGHDGVLMLSQDLLQAFGPFGKPLGGAALGLGGKLSRVASSLRGDPQLVEPRVTRRRGHAAQPATRPPRGAPQHALKRFTLRRDRQTLSRCLEPVEQRDVAWLVERCGKTLASGLRTLGDQTYEIAAALLGARAEQRNLMLDVGGEDAGVAHLSQQVAEPFELTARLPDPARIEQLACLLQRAAHAARRDAHRVHPLAFATARARIVLDEGVDLLLQVPAEMLDRGCTAPDHTASGCRQVECLEDLRAPVAPPRAGGAELALETRDQAFGAVTLLL